MKTIAASEAGPSLSSVRDDAAHEPVVIRRRQRNVAVGLAMHEYERLTGLDKREFQRFCNLVGQRAAAAGMNAKRLAELLRDGKRG